MLAVVYIVPPLSEVLSKTSEAFGTYLEYVDRKIQLFPQFHNLRCDRAPFSKPLKVAHIQLSQNKRLHFLEHT